MFSATVTHSSLFDFTRFKFQTLRREKNRVRNFRTEEGYAVAPIGKAIWTGFLRAENISKFKYCYYLRVRLKGGLEKWQWTVFIYSERKEF
jgi:hypothetical protein